MHPPPSSLGKGKGVKNFRKSICCGGVERFRSFNFGGGGGGHIILK